MNNARICNLAVTATLTFILMACGSSDDIQTTKVTGCVSAPGGNIAFNQPTGLERFFAEIFGKSVYAGIDGVSTVGAGVSVDLIEVDAKGDPVGAAIASAATTADGCFTIKAPAVFTPGPDKVVRAVGTTGQLEARVTALNTNIDPIPDAGSEIITRNVSDLAKLSIMEIFDSG